MKQLLVIIALLSCSTAFAQSQKDYEHVMAKYQRYYNNGNEDSIIYMFSDDIGKEYKQERLRKVQNKKGDLYYGVMRSWKYIGVDTEGTQGKPEEGVRFFLVTFDKTTHAMSFSLDKHNQFLTFRPMTFSDYIDSKLSKYYKGEGKKNYLEIKAKEKK